MTRIWFPAFMLWFRRLATLIAVVLIVAAYLGTYGITQSVQIAIAACVLIFVLFLAVLILALRRKPSTDID